MTRRKLAWPLLALLAAPALAADGRLVRSEVAAFPPYAELDKRLDTVTEAEYAETVAEKRFVLERLVYESGGLEVVAWAYRPAKATRPQPTIVFNRGSYLRNGFGFALAPSFRRFAEAGYAVIAPAYRESEGAGGVDEVGGADLADLMNVVPLAKSHQRYHFGPGT